MSTEPTRKPRIVRTTLHAHNETSVRTVVTTRAGKSLITDEPAAHGGTATAPTPLETVIGALCGCSTTTFSRAARELDLDYETIDFDAGYLLDLRGLRGQAEVVPYFQAVEVTVKVATNATPELLAKVVEVTEHRCPVRNLLVDAGVALKMTWKAVAPSASLE